MPKRTKTSPGQSGTHPMPLSELTPNSRNPRKITDQRLSALRRSLREFGDLSAIVFNRTTKRLVGGHQRTKIFQRDKAAKVIIVEILDKPDKWGTVATGYVELSDGNRFAYREVDWAEDREKAAMLAANAHGGEFDQEQVNVLLTELDDAAFDIDLTGLELPKIVDENEPENVNISERFEVVVECANEEEQQAIYEKLTQEGRSCRLLTF
jgi:ParB-like chromosome segregation protein Spo0J